MSVMFWVSHPIAALRHNLARHAPGHKRRPGAAYSPPIQSRKGRHSVSSARLPATMPTCPAVGLVQPGACPGRQEPVQGQGRGRRHDAVARRHRQEGRAGEARRIHHLAGDAPAAAWRARSAPYQPARHSRATGAASGTPSFSQSSSATKRRRAAPPGRAGRRRGTRSATAKGSSPANSDLHARPPAACRSPPAAAPAPAAARPRRRARRGRRRPRSPRASPAGRGARTRSGRRSAAARASSPPMQ